MWGDNPTIDSEKYEKALKQTQVYGEWVTDEDGYSSLWVTGLDSSEILEELTRYMQVPKSATREDIKDAIFAAALHKILHGTLYGPNQLRSELK